MTQSPESTTTEDSTVVFDEAPPKTLRDRTSSILEKLEIVKLRLLYRKTLVVDNRNLKGAGITRRETYNHDARHIMSPGAKCAL
jgi:hypothetical protein